MKNKALAKKLEKFGKVLKCDEVDGMFHVQITDGFKNSMLNTSECGVIIMGELGKRFPFVHKLTTDNNMFHLILKP